MAHHIYILSQTVGLAGYLLYISAPHGGTRAHILRVEILAYFLLGLQWGLLGQNLLLAGCLIAMTAAMLNVARFSPQTRIRLFGLLYLAMGVAVATAWRGSAADVFAGLGAALVLSGKMHEDMKKFHAFSGLAGLSLGMAAMCAFCWPAAFFNVFFAGGHLLKIARPLVASPCRQRPADPV